MQNNWNEKEAQQCRDDLALRVYSSRLIGREPRLVLHGGGNTSVKMTQPNLFGETESTLQVKASGFDLATMGSEGFVPLRLDPVVKLLDLETLDDRDMMDALRTQTLRPGAPNASVEALLHAVLPYKYVDHSHADAVLALTNSKEGRRRIEEIYGDQVVIIPYVMPGFDLAKRVAELFPQEQTAGTIGLILMNHGVFSFGETAKESYDRMIELADRAEA